MLTIFSQCIHQNMCCSNITHKYFSNLPMKCVILTQPTPIPRLPPTNTTPHLPSLHGHWSPTSSRGHCVRDPAFPARQSRRKPVAAAQSPARLPKAAGWERGARRSERRFFLALIPGQSINIAAAAADGIGISIPRIEICKPADGGRRRS